MKIYLIRHGQTTGDLENRYGGDYDDGLTNEGFIQADNLIKKLKSVNFNIIFSSPKIRAKQVTEKLSLVSGCKYRILDNLRERNKNGVLTGLTKDEASIKYPDLVEKVKDYRNQIEGAESFEEFKKRIEFVWQEILNSNYKTVAVITHGGVIITIFNDILKSGLVEIEDCGYAILNSENGNISLEKMDGIKLKANS